MTTINNLTIEQMREIVEGAPDTDMPMHYNVTNGVWIMSGFANRYFVDGEWKLLKDTNLGHFEFKTVSINELRTAIAEHDSREFKVGDLVVIKANPFWPEDYFIQQVEPENVGKWYMNAWRHAMPEEIKAGHRIDDNTDNCSDIRNHVSPSTLVWDLASGEDWTVEAERHG